MSSVNKVILVGNLTRDPEVRNTQAGEKIVNMSMATNDRWKDRNSGEMKERVEYHRIVIFNDRIGDVAERFLHKGSKVYVEGALQTRKWSDQSGQERYTTEVVIQRFKGELTLLDSKGGGDSGEDREPARQSGGSQRNTRQPAAAAPSGGPSWDSKKAGVPIDDDEIPF